MHPILTYASTLRPTCRVVKENKSREFIIKGKRRLLSFEMTIYQQEAPPRASTRSPQVLPAGLRIVFGHNRPQTPPSLSIPMLKAQRPLDKTQCPS